MHSLLNGPRIRSAGRTSKSPAHHSIKNRACRAEEVDSGRKQAENEEKSTGQR